MEQIANWLKKLGMSEYAERFTEDRIDLTVLQDLTDQDAKDLGVCSAIATKCCAIRDLGDVSAAVSAPSTPMATEATWHDDAERCQLAIMFCDLVRSDSTVAAKHSARSSGTGKHPLLATLRHPPASLGRQPASPPSPWLNPDFRLRK